MMSSTKLDREVESQILKNDDNANRIISFFLIAVAITTSIMYLLVLFKVMKTNIVLSSILWFFIISSSVVTTGLTHRYNYYGKWLKYALVLNVSIICFMINVLTFNRVPMILLFAIVLSFRYYDKKLLIFSLLITIFHTCLNSVFNSYLYPYFGFIDLNSVSYAEEPVIELSGSSWLYLPVINSNIDKLKILFNNLLLSALPQVMCALFTYGVGLMVVINGKKILSDNILMNRERLELEKELTNEKHKVMMSQIQPHFLYNSLSAIMAIDGNPDETIDAIGEFGRYLRENLDSLKLDETIEFKKELGHVERYLYLEKLRFKDKINVAYDINSSDYKIPPLSIQILVENAVKHGIQKRIDGGTITIKSYDDEINHIIEVEDDGVGFDTNIPIDTSLHHGIDNLRKRIESYMNGTLDITSMKDVGTKAIIKVPKGVQDENNSD